MLFEKVPLIQTIVATVCIYLAGWVIYCRYFHPLRSIPGPFLASISRSWIIFKTMKGDMEHTQRRLHQKHGYLVRIAPNEIACSDPESIKIIYGTKNVFNKTDFYDVWAPPKRNYAGHFPMRDEKEHSDRRRVVNSVYSMSSVLESEKAIDSCSELFCETMRVFASQKSVVDLGLWINMYAFDVLGELFFGKMFGYMRERIDIGNCMKAIDALLPAYTISGIVPSYLSKLCLSSTVLFSPSIRGAMGAVKLLDNASKTAVKRRNQEIEEKKDDRRDILRKLIEINADRGAHINFTERDIQRESYTALFAGADSTAIAINSILYHLMRHTTAYKKLTAKIDAAVADGKLSIPIAYAEAVKLPYLKACINEGMRLHPSVALTMPRIVPTEGATISGFSFAVVQLDKDVFGQDADNFNPDRWIEGDSVRMEKTMVQFGAGARTCLGKNISLSEIYKLVPQIIRAFHISLADPNKEWKTHNYWFNTQSNIHIKIEERTH